MPGSKLFQPFQLGDITLQNRVVMAPLTRLRADDEHVHGDLAVEYYAQRASVPGTLLITEATFIAQRAAGYDNVPGIWTDAQIAGWKKVTDAVHARGSFIYMQLWAIGRAAYRDVLRREYNDPSYELDGAGDIPITGAPKPRPITRDEIKEYVQLYATAASNAVHRANFDGVEIHNANGYLLDQFLQDVSNNRTDEYGGSIENRARFSLDVIEAVTKAVGQERVGIRFSPWGTFQDMRMKDPRPTFSYLVTRLRDDYPEFAYIHVTEPRVTAASDREPEEGESNDFLREIWGSRAYLSAGGYTRDLAIKDADEKNELIVFGRYFISNPDLPLRLKEDIPFTPYNHDTFYLPKNPIGYTDYPFAWRK
ncbi:hypothetical protein EWM64_g261 [Hericium alpestre]|uniref:NADH:flavin oxidoreductase/NADH oxidase N-terminal domain-containing protein n=1 Tax=Hericium alpestre TaxID=135208 RepID=A0A4Z0ACE1_9AGAM|nr:hypothetical protein EWM64_g261 [Hericium alpestre]